MKLVCVLEFCSQFFYTASFVECFITKVVTDEL